MSKNNPVTKKSFFEDIASTIEPREFTYNGKEKRVWVRRITGVERVKINQGVRYKATPDPATGKMVASMEFDKVDDLRRSYLLIYYAICDDDGSRVFRNPEAVAEEEGGIIDALLKIANEFNTEDTNEVVGKPSTTRESATSSD